MATSLIGGLLARNFTASQITACDISEEPLAKLSEKFSIKTSTDSLSAATEADIVMLAVKPQVMQIACEQLASTKNKAGQLFISIAAGVREADINRWLGGGRAVVRCMPNTPSLIQLGASGLFANEHTSIVQKNLAETVLKAAGIVQWVQSEAEIDAVTAVSGSGPAYYFLLMEAMIDAGVELGLSRETASELTIQTAIGAAQMAKESDVPNTRGASTRSKNRRSARL